MSSEAASSAWDLDFHGQKVDEVDKSAGRPPDGFYRARLEKTHDDKDANKVFTFRICHGPQTSRMASTKLKHPRFADNPETAMRRARVFSVRMGLADKSVEGRTASVDYSKAIGKEFVIKLKSRTFTGDKGDEIDFQDIDFAGVWPLDHGDLDAKTRTALGLPLLSGHTAAEPGKNGATAPADAGSVPAAGTPDALAKQLWG